MCFRCNKSNTSYFTGNEVELGGVHPPESVGTAMYDQC